MALADWLGVDQLLDAGADSELDRAGHLSSPHTFLELLELERPAWQAQAACAGVDLAVFFPERGESTAPAEAICAGCEVRDDCRDYALDGVGDWPGVWGGTSRHQRRPSSPWPAR